ncbi:SOS response-associated peptidase [Falsibacillus albus]|uniref:Abasic site processing protein n=1 Tax=Falsibacillus albus TaxID=2478915 RepID=A0A3L7JZS0_9BACI|nr:SOS response-associated peptidase [Falsibacillus albus]RLQ95181.1 SOS response-associated peptidase [Falsibacillus albus]
MCGRYTLTKSKETLIEQFLIDEFPEEFDRSFNVAPSQSVLALAGINNKRRAGYLKWGLIPHWVKEGKQWRPIINARAEKLEEKASFRGLVEKKRIILLADGFYEWGMHEGKKQPFRFIAKNQSLFAFAALWDKNGGQSTCTIITTGANEEVSSIHDRMPVIFLGEDQISKWLSEEPYENVKSLLKPLPDDEMTIYPVSSMVNSPKNNNESCIEKIALS